MQPLLKSAHIVPLQFDEGVLDLPAVPCVLSSAQQPKTCRKKDVSSLHVREEHNDDNNMVPEEEEGEEESTENTLLLQLVSSLLPPTPEQQELPRRALRSLQLLHENFSVHRLPHVVCCYQKEMLNAIHSACHARSQAAERMSFCVVCAINGKGFQSKLRMCSITGTLSCITCQPGKNIFRPMHLR